MSGTSGFKYLRYDFHIESPDDVEKIIALTEKVVAHCPVVDSLKRPTQVSSGEMTIFNPQ
ncbi:MAG: OsmC family protein [Thermodesulfovibrionales bacterium]